MREYKSSTAPFMALVRETGSLASSSSLGYPSLANCSMAEITRPLTFGV
eukprot:CAMPEP_0198701780 /NCGR_PEP_ID=MMETSP1468-20131203/388381_1 /TAXON_ID=1461545 /ORGANISM="Mantoniella sp, Strain CCMP1436" /LENGTH=48 /DNA_ID= /DNA_START= /DNA_END= /DNA_ORIENTATION=